MYLFKKSVPAAVTVSENASECVHLAAADLINDLTKVSGMAPAASGPNLIYVGSLMDSAFREKVKRAGIFLPAASKESEYFRAEEKDGTLYLIGSDDLGTMWAIYELSRRVLGVDPMYLFTDHEPAKKESVSVEGYLFEDHPRSYRFRGWFINDEDLIKGCCRGGRPEDGYDFHEDYLPLLGKIVETALRMKQNLLIPCSHVDMDAPAQEALVDFVTRRGMYISMHHVEPCGVSQPKLDMWFRQKGDATENINYIDHPEKYREIWRHYIRKWAKYPHVIWQLGLRGRGDRPVWYQNARVPDTVEARSKLISDAIAEQKRIIEEETGTKDFLSSTTLWMEGMPLYRAGALKFPENTMVILSDFGPDQMWDEAYYDTPRLPGTAYGSYYHVCFWGCGPHLVQGNRPEKILYNFRAAEERGDNVYSVLNVSNIREHLLGIRSVAELTWNTEGKEADRLIHDFCAEEYGNGEISALYNEYFDAFSHMDDSRVPGRMLLMDGMCKRVALMLMGILNGNALSKPDIQNKRLFAFDDEASFALFYERLTGEGIARFESVLRKANMYLPMIPAQRQLFFYENLILQTQTMLGLYRFVNALARAVCGDTGKADALREGCTALNVILQARSESESILRRFDGDTLMDIDGLKRLAAGILEKDDKKDYGGTII